MSPRPQHPVLHWLRTLVPRLPPGVSQENRGETWACSVPLTVARLHRELGLLGWARLEPVGFHSRSTFPPGGESPASAPSPLEPKAPENVSWRQAQPPPSTVRMVLGPRMKAQPANLGTLRMVTLFPEGLATGPLKSEHLIEPRLGVPWS